MIDIGISNAVGGLQALDGGKRAAIKANHASTRTTQLYDRRSDDITLDEVERVLVSQTM